MKHDPQLHELPPEVQVAWDRDIPDHWHGRPVDFVCSPWNREGGVHYVAWLDGRPSLKWAGEHWVEARPSEWMIYNVRLGRWFRQGLFRLPEEEGGANGRYT